MTMKSIPNSYYSLTPTEGDTSPRVGNWDEHFRMVCTEYLRIETTKESVMKAKLKP